MMITLGEGTGRIPKGTHDWDKFLTPDELCAIIEEAGLEVLDVTGMAWSPTRGFSLSDDKSLDYFVTARRAYISSAPNRHPSEGWGPCGFSVSLGASLHWPADLSAAALVARLPGIAGHP